MRTCPKRRLKKKPNKYSYFPYYTPPGTMRLVVRICVAIAITAVRLHAQAPTLFVVSPPSIAQGSSGFTLYLLGQTFTPNAVVRWNGSDRETTVWNPNELTAVIPAADV